MSGVFVSFEGPEGAGKSTQIRLLSERLNERQVEHVVTREPGGTPLANQLRAILADSPDGSIDARTELLMILASRSHHVEKVIRPELANNKMVVCDRFIDSTVCYQGAGRGIDRAQIEHLNDYATGGLVPDITFLIDVESEVGLQRLVKTRHALDRFEREKGGFHQRVRAAFRELAAASPRRFVVIRGDQEIEQVSDDVFNALVRAYPKLSKDS